MKSAIGFKIKDIMRFVNERRLDVIVPDNEIKSLTFNKGLQNTAIELIKIIRNHVG